MNHNRFIEIYQWRNPSPEVKNFNVQFFERNQCVKSQNFDTLDEAREMVTSANFSDNIIENLIP